MKKLSSRRGVRYPGDGVSFGAACYGCFPGTLFSLNRSSSALERTSLLTKNENSLADNREPIDYAFIHEQITADLIAHPPLLEDELYLSEIKI